jgi:hypothetical protein
MVVAETIARAEALTPNSTGPLMTTVHLGMDAHGLFIDGVAAEEFVSFEDLLPAYIADRKAEAEAEAAPHDPQVDGHDFDADFNKSESPFKLDAGHEVIAGANTLVNTASITSQWLDADVIAVAGDVVRLDAISQTNVVIDHDSTPGAALPGMIADQSSVAMNAASIALKSVAEARAESGNPAPKAEPEIIKNAPANWAVVRYEGPVTQVNWVKQHSFTTDFDQAVVTFSGAATFLGLGENALSNTFDLDAYGFQYDLILVAGNLIDINMINQLNIIFDSDVVNLSDTEADDDVDDDDDDDHDDRHDHDDDDDAPYFASGLTSGKTPSTQFEKSGKHADGGSSKKAGTEGLPEKPAASEKTDTDIKKGSSSKSKDDMSDAPVVKAPLSTGDNLAYNQALIETIGRDTDAAITKAFADVLDRFAKGDDDIDDDVREDEAFAGTELLRVLYIDGDFTTVNMVDQVNVLGDADQVHLARDNFAAALQDQIKIVTGSNVAANIAAIRDNGIDSKVMAKGEVYSDALIHQANLIDTTPDAEDSGIAALATEAVAFLADDLDAQTLGNEITNTTHSMIADMFGQSDLMQTMLS